MSTDQPMNGTDPGPSEGSFAPGLAPAPESVPAPARRGSVFTMSHALMAAAAVVALVAILGVVAYVVLGSQTPTPVAVTPGKPAAAPSGTPGSAPASGSLEPVPDVSNRDIFAPRNPFEPIAPPTIGAAAEETEETSTADPNTLVLKEFVTVDGEREAVVRLGGTEYTVGEGDTIGTSDFKVLEINGSTIVVLFGDERVTLSLGTGFSK